MARGKVGLAFSATASSSVCWSAIFRCGSHRGIQNARQPVSPMFASAFSRSMPTSMMIAPLPRPNSLAFEEDLDGPGGWAARHIAEAAEVRDDKVHVPVLGR